MDNNQGTKDPTNLFVEWTLVAPSMTSLSDMAKQRRLTANGNDESDENRRRKDRRAVVAAKLDRLLLHRLGTQLASQYSAGEFGLLCTDKQTSRQLGCSVSTIMTRAAQLPGRVYVPFPAVSEAFDHLHGGLHNGVGKSLKLLTARTPETSPQILLNEALACLRDEAEPLDDPAKLFVVRAKPARAPARP